MATVPTVNELDSEILLKQFSYYLRVLALRFLALLWRPKELLSPQPGIHTAAHFLSASVEKSDPLQEMMTADQTTDAYEREKEAKHRPQSQACDSRIL